MSILTKLSNQLRVMPHEQHRRHQGKHMTYPRNVSASWIPDVLRRHSKICYCNPVKISEWILDHGALMQSKLTTIYLHTSEQQSESSSQVLPMARHVVLKTVGIALTNIDAVQATTTTSEDKCIICR